MTCDVCGLPDNPWLWVDPPRPVETVELSGVSR